MGRIEAAARAAYESYMDGVIGCCEPSWDELPESHRDRLRKSQSAALKAAAPPGDAVERAAAAIGRYAETLPETSQGGTVLRSHRIGAARAALEAAGPWQGWQPIETAPKDGRRILLCLNALFSHERVIARWYDPWQVWLQDGEGEPDVDDGVYGIGALVPTNWQPLPPPPGSASPAPEGEVPGPPERCPGYGLAPCDAMGENESCSMCGYNETPPAGRNPTPTPTKGEARACTSDDVSERVEQPDPLAETVELLGARLEMAGVKPRSAANFDAETIVKGIADYAVEAAEERVIGPIRSKIRNEVKRALRDPEVRAELFSDEPGTE